MRILTFTTLFPNNVRPQHGIFIENRLRRIVETGVVEAKVIAPVPWFPAGIKFATRYDAYRRVAVHETRHGLDVAHPRYAVIPKVGMAVAPLLLRAALGRAVRRLARSGFDFDAIDAHYFYPDGVAAVMLGKSLGKPVVISARGSDLNLIADFAAPRRMIRWAAGNAAAVITVSDALRQRLQSIAPESAPAVVLPNGVDLQDFAPGDRMAARSQLGISKPTVLSVGNLVANKRHDLVLKAVASIAELELICVGDGPELANLQRLASTLAIVDRVRFLGAVPQGSLPQIYAAADVLVLASSREGWPNVLVESLACGTPVIAAGVGGVPEIVAAPEAGMLLPRVSPETIAEALTQMLAQPPDRDAVRRYAERFEWGPIISKQVELYRSLVDASRDVVSDWQATVAMPRRSLPDVR